MWSRKCPVGEMSVQGNVLVGKCPVGEVSFEEVSVRGNVRRGIVLGEVSVGELSAYRPKYASANWKWFFTKQKYPCNFKLNKKSVMT